MAKKPTYAHTQHAPLWLILSGSSLPMLVVGACLWAHPAVAAVLLVSGVLSLVLAFAFKHLTVRDEGECLAIRFGPLPLFHRQIAYAEITEVKAARSSWVDGWGIHYVPGRGVIYNLWGFDCVEIHLTDKLIRIGTDDPAGLLAFLATKTPSA